MPVRTNALFNPTQLTISTSTGSAAGLAAISAARSYQTATCANPRTDDHSDQSITQPAQLTISASTSSGAGIPGGLRRNRARDLADGPIRRQRSPRPLNKMSVRTKPLLTSPS
jgi:hypothetical protein